MSLIAVVALLLLSITVFRLCRTPIGFIGLKPALICRLAKLGARDFDPAERAGGNLATVVLCDESDSK